MAVRALGLTFFKVLARTTITFGCHAACPLVAFVLVFVSSRGRYHVQLQLRLLESMLVVSFPFPFVCVFVCVCVWHVDLIDC